MTVSYSPGSVTALGDSAGSTACIILLMIISHSTPSHGIHFACQVFKATSQDPFLAKQSEEWAGAEAGAAIMPGKVPLPTSIPFNATKNIWMLSLCHDNNHKYSTFFFFLCVSVSCLSLFRSLRSKTCKTFVFAASHRNWGQEWFNKSPHPCPVILQPAPTVLWGAILRAVFYGQFCTPSLPPP